MTSIREMSNEMYEKGKEVEELFIKLMEKDGYDCERPTKKQDKEEHWDVKLTKEAHEWYVDVKSEKQSTNEGYTWIELQNVEGKTGWLYAEKLHAIVFERHDRFDFVNVLKLRKLMDEKIKDKNERVFHKPKNLKEIEYRRYTRVMFGRDDLVVLTPFTDINKLIFKTVYK